MTETAAAPLTETKPRGELRSGWKPLIGGVALYGGSPIILLQTGGLFIQPIAEETGLPISVVAIAPIVTLLLALGQPVVGAMSQRTGTRPLAIIALATMVLGLIAVALVPASQLSFLLIAIFIGVGGSLGFTATVAKYLSLWFRKNFGFTFGIVGGAASVVPLIAIPFISSAIYNSGWQAGYWVLAGIVGIVCLPLVIFLFREPKRPVTLQLTEPDKETSIAKRAARSGTYREVLADARYWLILLSVLLVTMAIGGFLVHLQPILLLGGVPVETATAMTMTILVGVLTGRIAGGFLLDRLWPYWIPIVVLTITAVGAYLVTTSAASLAVPLLFVAVFSLGLAQGAEADFPAFFLLREFGPEKFAVISGFAFLVAGLGASIGGISFSALRDITGDYTVAGFVGSGFYALGMLFMLITGVLSRRAAARGQAVFAGHVA